MRKTELLVEAIEESEDLWYENFDSIEEAKKIISGAIKEIPEEYEIATVLTILDEDISEFDLYKSYKNALRKLKEELENDKDYR